LFAINLDPGMIEMTQRRVIKAGLRTVHLSTRDVVSDGFGGVPGSCEAMLLFNILHCEKAFIVLSAAAEAVRSGGVVAVIHWRTDIATPRGPSTAIRLRPDPILEWRTTVATSASRRKHTDAQSSATHGSAVRRLLAPSAGRRREQAICLVAHADAGHLAARLGALAARLRTATAVLHVVLFAFFATCVANLRAELAHAFGELGPAGHLVCRKRTHIRAAPVELDAAGERFDIILS